MIPGNDPIPTFDFAADVGPHLMVKTTATGMALANESTYATTGRMVMGATTEAGASNGKKAAVQLTGTAKVYAGATLTPGVHRELMVNAAGKVIPRGDASLNALHAIFVGTKAVSADNLADVRLVEVR